MNKTLAGVSVVALLPGWIAAAAAAQNLPDLGQAPAVVSLAPACAVNARKEPPDATVQRSCSEQDAVVAQVNGLVQAFSRLTNDVTALKVTSPKAGEIAKSQAQEYRDRANALNAIHGKLQEIIEVQALMASQLLTGRSLQTASQSLAALQLELLNLKTQSAMPASVSPSPASGTAANSGTISGRIVEDTTGAGVPGAVAIARCGDNGQDEYTTRTDGNGYYVFGNIAHGSAATPCLVRGAKFASPEENEEARKANKAPPRSFETRTIKNLSIPAGGGAATAADLRLPARTAGVGEYARAIVGFEQTGASSAPSVQKYFVDLWLSVPAPYLPRLSKNPWKDPNFGPRTQLWGDIRVTSTPQQVQSSIGDFAIGFASQFGALKVNEVAQASEFLTGVEVRAVDWGVTRSRLFSFDQNTRERFGLYLTAGFGTVTPFNPRDTVQVFNNPAPGVELAFDQQIAALGLTSQLAGKKFVAFASQDRDKFFRQYYAGIRLKTFYYDRDTDEPQRRFPATLDVVFGQNEAVTGGRLHRVVMRLEGFYPLPYSETNFMYLFGTADLILGRAHINNAVILQPATNNPAIPDPSILLISTPQLNRDHYRIGVGMDFLQVISKIKSKNDNKPQP